MTAPKPGHARMSSRERVMAAFQFQRPDRIPRFDSFWELPAAWEKALGPIEELSDIAIWVPDEGAFCTRTRELKRKGGWEYRVDTWGRTVRTRPGAYFAETVEVPIPEGTDPDRVCFDPPDLDSRYVRPSDGVSGDPADPLEGDRLCVFGKTGGPYLRTTYVRGEEQFLVDIASDPGLARALADKMADHLIGVAREQIRRWGLQESGVWIYDDMAYNDGPMFSPAAFERVFLPAYRRMVREYRAAGARWVALHSDGNLMPILDMLVDAGIDGLNPLEPRAGMDVEELRRRYPALVLIGGMDNSGTLIQGPRLRIEEEARRIIDLGREGGVVIGAHSISPEVPLENFRAYHQTCLRDGRFS